MPIRCLALDVVDRTPARNESNSAIGFQIVVVTRTVARRPAPRRPPVAGGAGW